jgi:hypothetical protein
MRTSWPNPTPQEIEELIAFLQPLNAEGFTPIKRWGGGAKDENGVLALPIPDYEDVVLRLVEAASKECWRDYEYIGKDAGSMIKNDEIVKNANLSQIKTMLTFFVRGERFCDGHWGGMIQDGYVSKLLKRLSEISSLAI